MAVSINAVYTTAEFLKAAHVSRSYYDTCRRKGLRTLKAGKLVYIAGRDWLAFLDGQNNHKKEKASSYHDNY